MAFTEEELGALYDAYQAKQGAATPTAGSTDARIGSDGILELTTGSPFPEEAANTVYDRAVADQMGTPAQRTFAGGITNLVDALSYGFGSEAISGINAGIDKIAPWIPKEQERSYDDYLNLTRSVRDEYRKNYFYDAVAADIVGGIASPGVGFKAINKAKNLKDLLKASTKAGVINSSITGFGEGEGGFIERAKSAGKSGAMAIALSPLITTAGYGLSRGLRPLTQAGQERAAQEAVSEATGEVGIENLSKYTPSEYGQKTLAEVTQSPGAANLEMQMRTEMGDAGGNTLLASLADRQANRQSALQVLAPSAFKGVTPEMRGNTIQKIASNIAQKVENTTRKVWEKVGKTGQRLGINGLPDATLGVADNLKTPLGYSSDANKVIGALFDGEGVAKNSLTIKEWQAIRSAAGEVGTAAAEKGRNREAAVMFKLIEDLDEAANAVAKGASPQANKIPLLRKAIAATRNQKTTYGVRAPKDILQKGDAGFRLRESLVPQKIINTPEGAKSFMKAFGKNKKLVEEARGALLDNMASKSPDTWVGYFNKNKAQFRYIFGDDYIKVKNILSDLASEKSVGKLRQMGTGTGSITGQTATAQKYLEEKTTGLFSRGAQLLGTITGGYLDGGTGATGAIAGAIVGEGARALEKRGQQEIKKLIVKALQSPEFTKELLSKPSKGWLDRLTPYLQTYANRESGRQFSSDSLESAKNELEGYTKQQSLARKFSEIENIRQQDKSPQVSKQEINNQIIDPFLKPEPKTATSQKVSYTPKKIKEITKDLPKVVKAIIQVESGYKNGLTSEKGAQGLMQLMPANQKKFGVKDPFDPEQNIIGGIKLLAEEMDRFKDNKLLAIAAYNAGSPRVLKAVEKAGSRSWARVRPHLPRETQEYVSKVLAESRRA
jgi:hypothetical protein